MKNEVTVLKQFTRLNPNADGSRRGLVTRRVLTLSLLALTSLANIPVRAQESSGTADSQDQVSPFTDHGLEGVWDVTVTIRDLAPPARVPRVRGLVLSGDTGTQDAW
jgi:hypothetical protein